MVHWSSSDLPQSLPKWAAWPAEGAVGRAEEEAGAVTARWRLQIKAKCPVTDSRRSREQLRSKIRTELRRLTPGRAMGCVTEETLPRAGG